MRVSLPYLLQIQGTRGAGEETTARQDGDDTASPNTQGLKQALGGWVAQTLKQLVAGVTTGYHIQHNDDDTHKTITATGSISERGRTTPMGQWLSAPVNASDYTGLGGLTWTVGAANVGHYAYMLVGTTLVVDVQINGATLGGSASGTLVIHLPGAYVVARDHSATMTYNNGTGAIGQLRVVSGDRYIQVIKADGSNFSTANTMTVGGQIAFEVTTDEVTATAASAYTLEYLAVGGGGGGGTCGASVNAISGGGGAGAVKTGTFVAAVHTAYVVTVGGGGAANTSGSSAIIAGVVTAGGGGAGGTSGGGNGAAGSNGSSGGGGGAAAGTGGAGSSPGTAGGDSGTSARAGGGGGASAAGHAGTVDGIGGAGSASSITGASVTYAGGGGGAGNGNPLGGAGGGGRGAQDNTAQGSAGTVNTGGGGGGGAFDGTNSTVYGPYAGGSGIVIIRYLGSQRGTGGTVTSSAGYTIHTFTASSTFTA